MISNKFQYSPFISVSTIFSFFLVSIITSGCVGWDDDIGFPEDFKDTYEALHECKPSVHQKAKSVITWLSPTGLDVWNQIIMNPQSEEEAQMGEGEGANLTFPSGTVAVKVQYSDEGCSVLDSYTAMIKLPAGSNVALGGWRWQFIDAEGGCNNCDGGTQCSGCHTQPLCSPTDLFCTRP